MDNFDLKKFLVENKMTRNSRLLNEDLTYDALPAEVKQRYENNGRLGVAFVKKDGSVRHMSFSKTLKAYQPSAAAKTDAQANYRQNNNLWSGYDVNAYIKAKKETGDDAAAAKQSFRNFKLENVLAFSAGGRVFDMRDENNIVERFGEDVAKALTQTMIQSLERDSAPTAVPTTVSESEESQLNENKASRIETMIQQEYPQIIEDGEVEQGTEEWLFLIQLALKAYGINIEDEYDILAAIDGEGPYAEQIENLDYEHISDLETALENLGVEVF
jgi:hypothetical protein